MKQFVLIDKPQGVTPLSAIETFRARTPEYETASLGVAGRLDPMADGLILVLVGDENKKRKNYEQLQKTYKMELLFGFETDTYDELGLVTQSADSSEVTNQIVSDAMARIPHSFDQPYPPYSSKPVNGKPLYYWARDGKLDTITIPVKKVTLYHQSLEKWQRISKKSVQTHIQTRIARVEGDFRQKEILEQWDRELAITAIQSFPVVTVTISCSSGTYMRGLAHMIGESIGIPALAFSIRRTHIGPYSLDDAVKIEC
jgi:tRNA pseudouridine55 synthase